MSDEKNGSMIPTIFGAFVVGALVGAGVALLVAPQSGKETREKLANKARDLKEKVIGMVAKGKNTAREIGQCAGDALHKGQDTLNPDLDSSQST